MRRLLVVVGVVIILLGAAALIHPQFAMPAKESQTTDFAGQEVIVRAQRIIHVPKTSGLLIIFVGLGFIFLGTLKHR